MSEELAEVIGRSLAQYKLQKWKQEDAEKQLRKVLKQLNINRNEVEMPEVLKPFISDLENNLKCLVTSVYQQGFNDGKEFVYQGN